MDNDRIGLAKRALHTSIPSELPCRESQIDFLLQFFSSHILKKIGGGLCISGSPGTGKTAVIHHVLEKLMQQTKPKTCDFVPVFINCVNLRCPTEVYDIIAKKIKLGTKGGGLRERLTERFTSEKGKMILLILDEMDQLLCPSGNDCLRHIFEITKPATSKLIVVGVANSLDLTNHLPFLNVTQGTSQAKITGRTRRAENTVPPIESFHFVPYERDEIAHILKTRLGGIDLENLFDPMAIKLVATKVASSSGDMRKALNACKIALDQMEKEGRCVIKATSKTESNVSSPKKRRIDDNATVGVGSIAKVLKPGKVDIDLPIQQLLLLATLLRIHHRTKLDSSVVTPISLYSVYQEYSHLSELKGFEYIDMSDVRTIFAMLEDRSLVSFASKQQPKQSSRKGVKAICNSPQSTEAVVFDPKKLQLILQDSDLLDAIAFS